MLHQNNNFRISSYNSIGKSGHFNRSSHGGVALFIHNTVPYTQINLNTEMQAVAATVFIGRKITICSVYSSRAHRLTVPELTELIRQLPPPILITGDFNAYNPTWGSPTVDSRGRIIEEVVNNENLIILNNGQPTRVTHNSKTAIDISIASPELDINCIWNVLRSPLTSDHNPILIDFTTGENEQDDETRLNIKKADWGSYKHHDIWNNLPDTETSSNNALITDFYERINTASMATIPSFTISKYFPKPWWSREIQQLRNKREHLYTKYHKNKSLINLIEWKKARAKFKAMSIKAKSDSWEKLTSTLNQNTPVNKIFEISRKIQGKPEKSKINILTENDITYSTPIEIVNKLAETFRKTSSTENYSQQFQTERIAREQEPLDFLSNNNETYNREFNIEELLYSISRTRNTSPGPDKIYPQMIKNLPELAIKHLLNIYNKMWKESFFPNQWKISTIVPIAKPGKDHNNPLNYRPISLTSIVCKIFERMINSRLTDYFDINKGISNIQCGSRKKRSTNDHLIRLETTIRNSYANNQHFISVFYDLEKAYDTTWRYGIMKDLRRKGLRGRLPLYIEQFLSDRKFKVRINNTYSNTEIQESGVPQGSILSVTLFILKIDEIAEQIPKDPNFHSSLYVDDLQIGYRHQDLNQIQTKLQQCMNKIHDWAQKNGCKFSKTKTKVVHFTTIPGLHPSPTLKLYNNILPYVDDIRFLGLIWDSKLTWEKHIATLKTNCQKPLNFLKSITNTKWGADQRTTLFLYRSFIRSKMDYGSIIYNSASNKTLQSLNTIANDALRLATGCFKCTKIETLQIIANEPSLAMRRIKQTIEYFFKIRSYLDNPARNQATIVTNQRLFQNKKIPAPFAIRATNIITELGIDKKYVKPAFSYKILNITTPTWTLTPPNINIELTEFTKSTTPSVRYRQEFNRIKAEQYPEHMHIYTDGSKTVTGVGAAAVTDNSTNMATLPKVATIYSAEIHAIQLAINITKNEQNTKFVIFSDSLSALTKLMNINYCHPILRKLQHDIETLRNSGKVVDLCWVPGHVNIAGNEKADAAAKLATNKPVQFISVYYKDWYPLIQEKIHKKWNDSWKTSNNFMVQIKPSICEWPTNKQITRQEEVILNRLRSGYTWLTHSHLMDQQVQVPNTPCELCFGTTINIKHLLVECPALVNKRAELFQHPETGQQYNLRQILLKTTLLPSLMQFLKDIRAYELI